MQDSYDVIIIGAGIGGLVCGCYLSKAGLKVLITEQHSSPGGCCSSYKRKGYNFDSGVHYIGGLKSGVLSTILEEINLKGDIKFNQVDPTDKIIIPNNSTYIRAENHDTINEFKKSFPSEKNNIDTFFGFIKQLHWTSVYRKVKNITLKELLDHFFKDEELKTIIGVLILGNMGLPPSKISAFASVIFFREFLLDPGYYPIGGMQEFSNHIASKFKEMGGELNLSEKTDKILVENNRAYGILTRSRKAYSTYIVSDIDANQLFNDLISIKTKEANIVDRLKTTESIFAVCLGIKAKLKDLINETCNIWCLNTEDLDFCYDSLSINIKNAEIPFIMLSSPSIKDSSWNNLTKDSLQIFSMASYESEEFWIKNRKIISEKIISMAGKLITNLRSKIDFESTATPVTIHKYTLNKNGAAFGWASTLDQINTSVLPQRASINNLYLVGHWCTIGTGQGGISTVALSGKKAAENIINIYRKSKPNLVTK